MKVNRASKKDLELRDFSFCFCLGISLAMEPYDRAELVWTMGDLGDVRVLSPRQICHRFRTESRYRFDMCFVAIC